MNQVNIISDLVKWIEKNLEQPLSIDTVAKKSGYSKWHLQRMFKEISNQVLGTYIRHRRLTHAALALKMTSKPILDIAMQYRFDSQQTFTRSFKKQFNITPASYRRSEFWDPTGLTPAIELHKTKLLLPEPSFVTLPERVFWGVTYKNNCSLYELLEENIKLRQEFFKRCFSNYAKSQQQLPNKVYAFSQVHKSKDKTDDQELFYTIALEESNKIDNAEQYRNEGGLYLCFKYIGHPDSFIDFIHQVYLAAIPALKVKLRSSCSIEVYYNRNHLTVQSVETLQEIECDYYIPIITDDVRNSL